MELRAWPGAGVPWPWPCPESRRPHRSALRWSCAGPRVGAAAHGGETGPGGTGSCSGHGTGEPLPAGMRLVVPFPLSFPPILSFTMTAAAAGPVRLPSPRWDCREILFHNRALSLPCCCSCCFLSLRWVGCLTLKTILENSV